MPLPSSNYQAMFPLQEVILGKDDGLPLANGIVTFYEDSSRTGAPIKKAIFQQVQLPDNTYEFVQLNNPITLSAIGSFMDDNGNDIIPFLYPYSGLPTDPTRGAIQLYYITVQDSNGVAQFTREGWPPNMATSSNVLSEFQSPTNELSNPQFNIVNFTPLTGYTFDVTGSQSTEIAPDWVVDTTGTGAVTVAQVVMPLNTPSNPPYALKISSTAVTTIQLRQRLTVSSRLLASNYVSGTFIAKSTSAPVQLALSYRPSTSTSTTLVVQIASGTTTTSNFTTIANSEAALINISNVDSAPTGYIDIFFDIPPSAEVEISSVQIVGVQNSGSSTQYMQQSNAREIDHLYHYYNLPLQEKPISSYLIGWDFPLNPAQWGATVSPNASGTNKSYYAWDQTIVFQSANSAIAISRESTANLFTLTAAVSTQIGIIQYLDATDAKQVLFQAATGGISVNVEAEITTVQQVTVSLWWSANPVGTGMTTGNSLVTALDATGHPSVEAGWSEIKLASNLGNATFTSLGTLSTQKVGFSNFVDDNAYKTGISFAIVVGFSTAAPGAIIEINSISLVPGKIPTKPAPKTLNEVLMDCQRYYQKSFAPSTIPSNNAGFSGTAFGLQNKGQLVSTDGPYIKFSFPMRVAPIGKVILYNPSATNNNIRNITVPGDYSASTANTIHVGGFLTTGMSNSTSAALNLIAVNWSADARLGVI